MKLGTGTGITLSLGAIPVFAKDKRDKNPVIRENNKPGTTDWQLTRVRPDKDQHRTTFIEGYCSKQSIRAFLGVGHDEYWYISQFRGVETLRDEGVNLLFFSGNSVCWVSPFSANSKGVASREIIRAGSYGANRNFAEHVKKTEGPFTERGSDEGLLMGVRNIIPVNGGGDWIITKPEHGMFDGTGVKKGNKIPSLIGWEYQGDAAAIEGLEIVVPGIAWQGGQNPSKWQSVVYPGPKGILFLMPPQYYGQMD